MESKKYLGVHSLRYWCEEAYCYETTSNHTFNIGTVFVASTSAVGVECCTARVHTYKITTKQEQYTESKIDAASKCDIEPASHPVMWMIMELFYVLLNGTTHVSATERNYVFMHFILLFSFYQKLSISWEEVKRLHHNPTQQSWPETYVYIHTNINE